MVIARRDAIALLGAGLASASAAPAMAAARRGPSHSPIDFNSSSGRLRTFIMMRGALDDQLVMSWVNGRYYGVVDDVATPLFGVNSCVFSRYRPAPDGGYEAVTVEFAYFTDTATGKVIDTYRNPYTDKDCTVPGGGYSPTRIFIGADLSFRLGKPIPGFKLDHRIDPPIVAGNDVWISEHAVSEAQVPGGGKPFRYTESVTYHAKRSDLEVPGAKRAPSDVNFTNIVGWRPWLGMGDHPGHLTCIGIGKQGASRETLPPAWVEATRQRHPELLHDPLSVLAPLWNAK